MTWTTNLPTKSGWWWWRPTETTDKIFQQDVPCGIYPIKKDECSNLVYFVLPTASSRYPAKMLAGEWSSEPVPEPEEPA